MGNLQIEYQKVLDTLHDTSVILFDKELNINQIFGRDGVLDILFPGMNTIREWAGSMQEALQEDLVRILQEVLGGSEYRVDLEHPEGLLTLQAKGFKDASGLPFGMLVFQLKRTSENLHGRRLIREKQEAEEHSEIKSRFMARISHEIRTPLNAIIGFVEQLQKTSLNKKQKNFTSIIEKSSEYLLDLVNEILSFSRLESGEMKLDEVDFSLESLVREIYETFKVRANDKGINLRYLYDERLDMIFWGDAFRLKQVIINLVSNGIKFTEYGYVELKVSLMEELEDQVWIEIAVSDTGIGVAEKRIHEIFDEYKQASAGIARKHGGSGLGLTISKRLVEVMKGRISVESREGKGSVFSVEIPLVRSQKKYLTKDVMQVDSEELSGIKVLLVDDDAMNRALGHIILEGFNMDVSLVSDGLEAMAEFEKEDFDLILLDIHMPEVSGLDVARQIRSKAKKKEVKIIAVTADILQEDKKMLDMLGIDDVLIKPYREINLYNKICQVLEVESKIILKESIEITAGPAQEIPLYDLSELRAVTRDSVDFFHEMIDTFIENALEGIKQIKTAYEKEDWEEMKETAHRLIPSFKHLAITSVVSDLVEIKSHASGSPETALLDGLIQQMEQTTLQAIAQLKLEKASAKH